MEFLFDSDGAEVEVGAGVDVDDEAEAIRFCRMREWIFSLVEISS